MNNINNSNLLNKLLFCFNPRFPLTCNHYTCGFNLVIFSSIAQVENCLTGATNSCKSLIANNKKSLREAKNQMDTTENPNENIK